MDLFNQESVTNVLPYDGVADYYGKVLTQQSADTYYDRLLKTVTWQHDKLVMFGKPIITQRKVAWYGDRDYAYTYSNATKQALTWTDELAQLKATVEARAGCSFNSCLLNLYHSGDEGMGWHSDDERSLGNDITIASLSLGAERKFSFKHKQDKRTVSLLLEHGSLLVMREATQQHWRHALPKTKKVRQPRINLTFRTIFQ